MSPFLRPDPGPSSADIPVAAVATLVRPPLVCSIETAREVDLQSIHIIDEITYAPSDVVPLGYLKDYITFGQALVAKFQQITVGYLLYTLSPGRDPDGRRQPQGVRLASMAVHPSWRRRQVGSQLWQHLASYTRYRKPRVGTLWVNVMENNLVFCQFLRSQGMTATKVLPDYCTHQGKRYDAFQFVKEMPYTTDAKSMCQRHPKRFGKSSHMEQE